ncbi:Fis family transcriptional regulator [Rhodonellum psychrophilum GCM71 = DSM 17998]|uniref:Very short patch repair endonuclease n=1 Tax=Rhodonellum psychrophilum GCM71 = DSM 17998 TaxID=1123057 RepID=U5BUT8_9BACT|nr:very short patch repair endonuclease [Rhodonellum psychrophilum]ERM81309.1 Fis family transcriptional regulator [Rhodonellum psychrophilum GCM71 = DSM 17998]
MSGKRYTEAKITVPKFCEEEGFYTTKQRSYNMSQIRGKNTKPEILLKKALWHAGLRHRSNKQKLPGKPDIAFLKYKLLIFIDGAFWHGYDWENRKESIKSNRAFWMPKIERNRQRDREINQHYVQKGWTVLRIWDFEVKRENIDALIDRIRKEKEKVQKRKI